MLENVGADRFKSFYWVRSMVIRKIENDKKIKAGVIGWPISHTLSPRLHQYWLDLYDINGTYEALGIEPDNCKRFISKLSAYGFVGVNITLPYKEIAARAVHILDDNARRLGAVNTIVVSAKGILYGSNTDGFGFMENLTINAPKWSPMDGPAVVLGAGGAAKAVVASLLDSGVAEVRITNRTLKKAEALVEKIGGSVNIVKWDNRSKALNNAALLVNTTTLGMIGRPKLDINLKFLPVSAVVNDIVYSPLMTPLLEQANHRSNPIVGGIGMLLHQARPGFKKWFGQEPEVTDGLKNHVLLGVK